MNNLSNTKIHEILLAKVTTRHRYRIEPDETTILNVYADSSAGATAMKRLYVKNQKPPSLPPDILLVNIIGVDATQPDMRKIEFLFHGEKITGWVYLERLCLHSEAETEYIFDGRFNDPLE